MAESYDTGTVTHHICPLCGAPLYTDGVSLWCSKVGGDACAYGVLSAVLLESKRDTALYWDRRSTKSALTKGQRLIWRQRIYEHLQRSPNAVAGAIRMTVDGGTSEPEAQRLVNYIIAYHFKEKIR